MGWTSCDAHYYKANGKVDVKAECDHMFCKNYEVIKSCLKGSVYYGALKDSETNEIFAVIVKTSTSCADGFNFGYKEMDETCGPYECDCPDSILDLLTEPENEWAKEWREKCRMNNKAKKKLSNLPVGSVIRFKIRDTEYEIEKRSPNRQFKTNWWKVIGENKYYSKTNIPIDFEVISVGA